MGKEILAVPEHALYEVIYVIRLGLKQVEEAGGDPHVSHRTFYNLDKWCNEEEAYLKELASGEDPDPTYASGL